jgi:UDP-2,3-diacylglucosamine hydrolase
LGKLAELRDGIPIYFFVGNHDLWMEDYLKELNIPVFMTIKNTLWRETFPYYGDGKTSIQNLTTHENQLPMVLLLATSDLGVKLAQYLSVKTNW